LTCFEITSTNKREAKTDRHRRSKICRGETTSRSTRFRCIHKKLGSQITLSRDFSQGLPSPEHYVYQHYTVTTFLIPARQFSLIICTLMFYNLQDKTLTFKAVYICSGSRKFHFATSIINQGIQSTSHLLVSTVDHIANYSR